ncbi:MAG: hypothetical protein RIB84_16680 [Sneathiellaceae bacterium]
MAEAADAPPEVFLYTPGRTATTSLGTTLSRYGIGHVTTHNLDWALWAERRRHGIGATIQAGPAGGIQYELQRMRRFEVALARVGNGARAPAKIVVGVRFPYDHLFSVIAYSAQNQIDSLSRAGMANRSDEGIVLDLDGYRRVIEEAAQIYHRCHSTDPGFLQAPGTGSGYLPPVDGRSELRNFSLFYMQYMQTWLRLEFQSVLGVDLTARTPVRRSDGAAVYASRYGEVLLYALDHPALDLSAALSAFLGRGPIEVSHDNDSSSRNPGFHDLAMRLKAELQGRELLLDHYRADPLIRAIYAGTGKL